MLDILFGIWLICFGLYLMITSCLGLSSKNKKGEWYGASFEIRLFFLGLMSIILSFGFLYGEASLVEIVGGFLN